MADEKTIDKIYETMHDKNGCYFRVNDNYKKAAQSIRSDHNPASPKKETNFIVKKK